MLVTSLKPRGIPRELDARGSRQAVRSWDRNGGDDAKTHNHNEQPFCSSRVELRRLQYQYKDSLLGNRCAARVLGYGPANKRRRDAAERRNENERILKPPMPRVGLGVRPGRAGSSGGVGLASGGRQYYSSGGDMEPLKGKAQANQANFQKWSSSGAL